ncbi:hypothetical protein E1B28_002067 [Marasmius oreades]|uniref:Uncharacterized protein n=1 Tax=Marasmius oreades TaxID=181124 RepID=A0A9P7V4X5_9AGAR|nr:uncharacterized protein E1B28_002067 [Marasmius oreades]KAG7100294.1 hypothetical protein E1B28_002067 [Marasmius oreades]
MQSTQTRSYYGKKFPPEVVKRILQNLHHDLNELPFHYALVGKDWFRIWLSYGWKKVRDIYRILIALTQGEIRTSPTEANWLRFESVYAPHVQHIVLRPCVNRPPAMRGIARLYMLFLERYPTALSIPDAENGPLRIFRNLRFISLLSFCCVELPETVGHFIAIAYMISHPGVIGFEVVEHHQKLRKHGIQLGYTYQGVSVHGTPGSYQIQVHLKRFGVYGPKKFKRWLDVLGGAWAKTSSRNIMLPKDKEGLDSLAAKGYNNHSTVFFTHTVRRTPEEIKGLPLLLGSWTSLREVDLKFSWVVALQFLNNLLRGHSQTLTKVRFELQYKLSKGCGIEDDSGLLEALRVRSLFEKISVCAPSLLSLEIIVHPVDSTMLEYENVVRSTRSITFDVLRPLRGCSKLKVLKIRDIYPPMMNTRDVDRLVKGWSEMNTFALAPSKDVLGQWHARKGGWKDTSLAMTMVDVGVVRVFSKRCPRLSSFEVLLGRSPTRMELGQLNFNAPRLAKVKTIFINNFGLVPRGSDVYWFRGESGL